MHTLKRDNYPINLLGTFKPPQYHKNEVEEKNNSVSAVVENTQLLSNETEVILNKKEFNIKTLIDIIQFSTTLFCQFKNNSFTNCDPYDISISPSSIDFGISNFFDFILEKINSEISELLQADRATIFIYDEDKKQLWSKVAQSCNKYESLEIRIPHDEGIAGSVARTGKILNIPDVYQNSLFNSSVDEKIGYITKNVLCVPLFNSKERTIGVIQVLNKRQGGTPFQDEDEKVLCSVAKFLGIFMEVLESTLNETYQKLTEKTDFNHSTKIKNPWITEINKGDQLQKTTNLNDFWE